MISYQGKVTDTGGTPVADGSYTMRFRIYDAVSGGNLEWDSGAMSVSVSGGIFNVLLGESPQPSLGLSFEEDCWISVTVGGDVQSPRQRLGSVGYAYMASGLVPGTEVIADGDITTAIIGRCLSTWYGAEGIWGFSTALYGKGVRGDGYYGVSGGTSSTEGTGVYGEASSTSGEAHGGQFRSRSPSGYGLYAINEADNGTAYGIYGKTESTGGIAVYGVADATSGTTYGGWFKSVSPSGRAVYGEATGTWGVNHGIYGRNYSTDGRGVSGWASATTGENYGGAFSSASNTGTGVFGSAYSTSGYPGGDGVRGETNGTSGRGVAGIALSTTGSSIGVYGSSSSPDGTGIFGAVYTSTGVATGVHGISDSGSGKAVYAEARATSGTNCGVYGLTNSLGGYGVYYQGGFGGTGLMRNIVLTSQGPTGLDVHTTAGTWVEDFGAGRLTNGRCRIELDPLFLETVTIDDANPMKVFVELHDEYCNGVAVKKSQTGFDVVERHGGSSNGSFDYRVVAKRKGFEQKRLDYCKAAENDSYLYPELREKELRDHNEN